MPTEKMTMVILSGPLEQIDTVFQRYVMDRDFHIENAIDAIGNVLPVTRFGAANPYSEGLSLAVSLLSKLDIQPDFRPFKDREPDPEAVRAYLGDLSKKLSAAIALRDDNARRALDCANIQSQLAYFSGVDEVLKNLLHMRYVLMRMGRIPANKYEICFREMESNKQVYYVSTGVHGEWNYGMYFVLPEAADKVDSIFASLGFERVRVSGDLNYDFTPGEEAKRLKAEEAAAEKEAAEQARIIEGLKNTEAELLLYYYSYLRYMSDTFDLRYYACYSYYLFYIIGWVPASQAEAYIKDYESNEGFSCITGGLEELVKSKPPVKLKSGFLSRIFSPFVAMYGMPSYGEIDPRNYMAITYTIIFGIMFGDVGQGALLSIAGLILWKTKKMWIGRILALAGCSSIIFGFVFGSVFGFEDILPGFKVLEGGNTMKMLLIAVAIGVVLLVVCMVMNIINGIMQKDIKKIFFSPNGVVGIVFYLAVMLGLAMTVLKGVKVFTGGYVIGLIILPLVLLFIATPLSNLLMGKKDWKPHSMGMFIVEGFFEMFETVLSYVSNTVSFLRVGAYAISHAGMMMVVFLLAQTATGGHNPVTLILGNLLVMGIESVLVCIQVMRLEFYEMFGRFYSGEGQPFAPRTIDYKAVPQKNTI